MARFALWIVARDESKGLEMCRDAHVSSRNLVVRRNERVNLRRAKLDSEPLRSPLMAKELFGTDGIRGEPGKSPLDDATLYAVGRALGAYLAKQHRAPRVLIGMDTRESGPHIAALLAAGLMAAGTSTRRLRA